MSDSPLQQPISTKTKVELVVERLVSYLREGGIKPGENLPKEEDLAKNLQVSRPVIREALSHLKMLGMLRSKKKSGMVLAEPRLMDTLERMMLPNLLFENTRQDIFELRLILELGLADLLYARISKEDLAELDDIIGQEKILLSQERSTKNINELVEIDANFHGKLYQVTGNSMLQSIQRVILPTTRYVIQHQLNMDRLSYGKVTHSDLVKELKTGKPESFRQAMRQHLELYFDKIIFIIIPKHLP